MPTRTGSREEVGDHAADALRYLVATKPRTISQRKLRGGKRSGSIVVDSTYFVIQSKCVGKLLPA